MGGVSGIVQSCLILVFLTFSLIAAGPVETQPSPSNTPFLSPPTDSPTQSTKSTDPVEITADNLEFDQVREVYTANGSVVVIQGPVRLTADQVIFHKLSGHMIANGHVYLRDDASDLWTEELDLNVNTEAGVITKGRIFLRERNSFVTGRKIQRFSETHYRVKDGSFTNCDAKDGEIPAWRFTFKDIDLDWDDSSVWG